MFQKHILNLRLVFPLCYFFLLAHCNFLVVHKYFWVCPPWNLNTQSLLGAHSCPEAQLFGLLEHQECNGLLVQHTSPMSYSLSLKAHLIIIKVMKRRKYIMKCTLMIPQSRSGEERFGHSDSPWAQYSWGQNCHPSTPCTLCSSCQMHMVLHCLLHFSFFSSLRTTWTLDHFSLWSCRGRNWRSTSQGQWDCAWVMCWGTGRGAPSPATVTPLPPHPLPAARAQNQL